MIFLHPVKKNIAPVGTECTFTWKLLKSFNISGARTIESHRFDGTALARFGKFIEFSTWHGCRNGRYVIACSSSSLFFALSLSGKTLNCFTFFNDWWLILFINHYFIDKWINIAAWTICSSTSTSPSSCSFPFSSVAQCFTRWNCLTATTSSHSAI